ncbi:hypothetical protein GLV98_15235 [Halobacillus litoralis]|uniref:Uncharacterized protein n=1 Tax=Halobacillus litoralis TaxID=45668 RepID=A0A845E4Z2_9BACI|nr:hypothetical protein [Halobacillus litoralis]
MSVLKKDKNRSSVTLITYNPIPNPTHRLIVQAVLK